MVNSQESLADTVSFDSLDVTQASSSNFSGEHSCESVDPLVWSVWSNIGVEVKRVKELEPFVPILFP